MKYDSRNWPEGSNIIAIPPRYSDADRYTIEVLTDALDSMEREHARQRKVLVDRIVEIENRYPQRLMYIGIDKGTFDAE